MTQSERDKMKQEARDLRKPQVHDREWFKRIDKFLDSIIRTRDSDNASSN